MPLFLFLLLVGLPILEVYTFIQVGEAIDVWPTIGLVLLTALVGTALIRWQGMTVLRRAQEALGRGEAPLREVFDGVCLLVAGALLLTPGFITDAMGFALVLPPFRVGVLLMVLSLIKSGRIKMKTSNSWTQQGAAHHAGPHSGPQFGADPRAGASPFGGNPHADPHATARPGQGWGQRRSGPEIVDGDYRDVTDQERSDKPTSNDPRKDG